MSAVQALTPSSWATVEQWTRVGEDDGVQKSVSVTLQHRGPHPFETRFVIEIDHDEKLVVSVAVASAILRGFRAVGFAAAEHVGLVL